MAVPAIDVSRLSIQEQMELIRLEDEMDNRRAQSLFSEMYPEVDTGRNLLNQLVQVYNVNIGAAPTCTK